MVRHSRPESETDFHIRMVDACERRIRVLRQLMEKSTSAVSRSRIQGKIAKESTNLHVHKIMLRDSAETIG